ncbi:unnamed protein product [Arctia plantaginis]|uniref:Tetraspanin n=1 Tax=Arctia plantaginis TaxID=874455 RepID=A0A8S0ZMK3_ARCPL|nr:unnamed protein product [Arctia plantaginis]
MLNFAEITKTCAKGLLIVLNVFCILIALTRLGFALVDIKVLKRYGEEQSGECIAGDVIIVVASLVLIGVAIFGCVGAIKGCIQMLHLYVCFVLLIIILELLIAIHVLVMRYDLQLRVTEWIREDFYKNVTVSEVEEHLKIWDRLQTANECCGLNNPNDYIVLRQRIPISCCARAYSANNEIARQLMYKSCIEFKTYYKNGCEEEILCMLQSDSNGLIMVVVVSFWFEACGILLALWVLKHLRSSVQVYKAIVKY